MAGNRTVLRIVGQLQLLGRVFAAPRFAQDLSVVSWTYLRHRRILRAIERGDSAAAERAMAEHLEQSRVRLLRCHDQQAEAREGIAADAALDDALSALKAVEDWDASVPTGDLPSLQNAED
jgi:hypothetical protein